MKLKIKTIKAQAWGMDLAIALILFSIAMLTFYIYSLNQPGEAKEKLELMLYDGKVIANNCLLYTSPSPRDRS